MRKFLSKPSEAAGPRSAGPVCPRPRFPLPRGGACRSSTNARADRNFWEARRAARPADVAAEFIWVANNVGLADASIEDAPSAVAWELVCMLREDPNARRTFLTETYAKLALALYDRDRRTAPPPVIEFDDQPAHETYAQFRAELEACCGDPPARMDRPGNAWA